MSWQKIVQGFPLFWVCRNFFKKILQKVVIFRKKWNFRGKKCARSWRLYLLENWDFEEVWDQKCRENGFWSWICFQTWLIWDFQANLPLKSGLSTKKTQNNKNRQLSKKITPAETRHDWKNESDDLTQSTHVFHASVDFPFAIAKYLGLVVDLLDATPSELLWIMHIRFSIFPELFWADRFPSVGRIRDISCPKGQILIQVECLRPKIYRCAK